MTQEPLSNGAWQHSDGYSFPFMSQRIERQCGDTTILCGSE